MWGVGIGFLSAMAVLVSQLALHHRYGERGRLCVAAMYALLSIFNFAAVTGGSRWWRRARIIMGSGWMLAALLFGAYALEW